MSHLPRSLTPTGWGLVASMAVLGVAAAVLRFAELSVLAVGCFAALAGAAVVIGRAPALTARVEVMPARVERGGAAVARVTIQNVGSRRAGALDLHVPHGDTATGTRLRSLPAGARRTIAVPLPTPRRGAISIGPVVVRRSDPFGLAARSTVLGAPVVLHVHPMVHRLMPLPSARASSPDGLPVDSAMEGGVTFHALREYIPGDDPRHLHWRSSAKAGSLLVRRYVDPSEPVTTVLLDTRARAYPAGFAGQAAFDAAVDAAASILLASARARFPARLRTTGGQRLACRGNRGDELRLLDALAQVDRDDPAAPDTDGPADSLTIAVRALNRRAMGTLALLSGAAVADQAAAAAVALSWFEHVVIARMGPSSPRPGASADVGTPLVTGVTGRLRVLDVADAAALASAWPATARPGRPW
jgi:uncharacterized protein (DUF58 family)